MLSAGGSCACTVIAPAGGEGQNTVFQAVDSVISAEIESAAASHFSAETGAGTLTVKVSEQAEAGETAAVTCKAENYAVQNSLEVEVRDSRRVTLKLIMSYDSESPVDITLKAVALDARGQLIEGAQCEEEDFSKLPEDKEHLSLLGVDVPSSAAQLIIFEKMHYKKEISNLPGGDLPDSDTVLPLVGVALAEAEEYDTEQGDYFCWDDPSQWAYGPFADAAFSYPVFRMNDPGAPVGVRIYFNTECQNSKGIKAAVSDVHSGNTAVLSDNLETLRAGTADILGNWYGIEGSVWITSCVVFGGEY